MKTVLVLASAIGFAASAAYAECSYHSKVNAAVDTETTTASISKSETETAEADEDLILDRKAEEASE
ncbi:hypothetical protein LXM94_11175 [Rhizobium sp. TRM95111]|uniref:hypothetical protein n=1 Tax=Rhizobium alarense TaxID=2846851 RepID=UPI001F39878A|nr:hypothetical protein [Rhizobium alarense]MCF3640525.1 hypothetical protein [Rhizobium alarense]